MSQRQRRDPSSHARSHLASRRSRASRQALPACRQGWASGGYPYLKGVALHQRDVLLVYQCVLGLEINHIPRRYLWDPGAVPVTGQMAPSDEEVSRCWHSTHHKGGETCQKLVTPRQDRTRGAGIRLPPTHLRLTRTNATKHPTSKLCISMCP